MFSIARYVYCRNGLYRFISFATSDGGGRIATLGENHRQLALVWRPQLNEGGLLSGHTLTGANTVEDTIDLSQMMLLGTYGWRYVVLPAPHGHV